MFDVREMTDTLYLNMGEGYSVNADGEAPKTGYMVGGYANALEFNRQTDFEFLLTDRYLTEHSNLLQSGEYFAGIWTDSDTGRVYVDISRNVQDLAEALAVADNFGEIAIWDVENNREIRLTD